MLQRIGETFPPKITRTRAHGRAEYDVEFVDARAFPGGPAVAGDARRVADRTKRHNRNACLLWNGADDEGWMARDPAAGLAFCARLFSSEVPAMQYIIF
jgi:hypothetical protein